MKAEIISNRHLHDSYYEITFHAPEIAMAAQPGQFVHVRIDQRTDRILRRPFSIFDAFPADGTVQVVYKVVGKGTLALSLLRADGETSCDLLGPLGRGYTPTDETATPIAVAGAYGAAAMHMLCRCCAKPGILLIGARSRADLVLEDVYARNGWQVLIATDDGSRGVKGNVLALWEEMKRLAPGKKFFYGCGPHPMLMALAKKLNAENAAGELSIDHAMCCGVGACFACVVKVKDAASPEGWRYARSCSEGPVFGLDEVYTD